MSKVIVIGGGASGLVAAIYAAKVGNDVCVLERNSNCGKKLLVTGNGHCNYYNIDQSIEHYHSSSKNDLYKIINEESNIDNLQFFESIGIFPKIKNGYYYPLSNQSISILNALITEVKLLNVEIKNNILVTDVFKEDNRFQVITDYEVYECDKLIVSCGGKAAPKTGSDGFGYSLLEKFGHEIIKPLPALVQLVCEDNITKAWAGIRSDVKLNLFVNGKIEKEETGEIMLTDYGVSGICVFNLSGIAAKEIAKNNKVILKINFVPNMELTKESFNEFNKKIKNRTISQILDGFLNYKLVNALLKKIKINPQAEWDELTDLEQKELIKILTKYEIEIKDTKSFDSAQVCSGGLSLEQINLETMESKLVPNMFVTGELLDVDGDCGGYNLNWAWTSGKLAGKGTGKND